MKTLTDKELRELDAWIAEHVFGWHRQSFENGYLRQNLLVENKFRADKYRRHGWHNDVEVLDTFPKFSTDPAAAMQVLEKCIEKEPNGIVCGNLKGQWCATTHGWGGAFCEAETLPLAICLFAKQLFSK